MGSAVGVLAGAEVGHGSGEGLVEGLAVAGGELAGQREWSVAHLVEVEFLVGGVVGLVAVGVDVGDPHGDDAGKVIDVDRPGGVEEGVLIGGELRSGGGSESAEQDADLVGGHRSRGEGGAEGGEAAELAGGLQASCGGARSDVGLVLEPRPGGRGAVEFVQGVGVEAGQQVQVAGIQAGAMSFQGDELTQELIGRQLMHRPGARLVASLEHVFDRTTGVRQRRGKS